MNHKEFVAKFATRTAITNVASSAIINEVFMLIKEELEVNNKVLINNFWSFSTIHSKARKGFNPIAKTEITIPAMYKAKFKPAKNLKALINK